MSIDHNNQINFMPPAGVSRLGRCSDSGAAAPLLEVTPCQHLCENNSTQLMLNILIFATCQETSVINTQNSATNLSPKSGKHVWPTTAQYIVTWRLVKKMDNEPLTYFGGYTHVESTIPRLQLGSANRCRLDRNRYGPPTI